MVASVTNSIPRLTELDDEDLEQLLALASGSDSIELKLTIPDTNQRPTMMALGVDPLNSQIRQVTFFDTPDLALSQAGVVVRARRVQGRGDDTVVKLRPVRPQDIPKHLRRSPGMVVELDAMPGGYVVSATLKNRLGTTDVTRCLAGERPIRKLFSKEQRAFFAAHAPDGLELDALSVLGPIFVLKLAWVPKQFRRKLVGEMWMYPDGSRIVELSTKCAPAEMFQVAMEARAYLGRHGVDLSGAQQTKTRTALEYFAGELVAA
jgi:hypothetical protein